MRVARLVILFVIFVAIPTALFAQQAAQPIQRDPQATAVLQGALAPMGGAVPADSVATGKIVVTAGSTTERGTIRVLTRGLDQSSEQIQMPDGLRSLIYSRGEAREIEGAFSRSLQAELTVTSQSPQFPLVIIAAALSDSNTAYRYIGLESVNGFPAHHVSFWNASFTQPRLQHLAAFSTKEIWIDAASGLARKMSYFQRAARGAEPGILIEVYYSDYRPLGGPLYPFNIQKSLNGTPWATITIDLVSFNNRLTDTDFPVQ